MCVGPDDGVGLQAEHNGLGDGADDVHGQHYFLSFLGLLVGLWQFLIHLDVC